MDLISSFGHISSLHPNIVEVVPLDDPTVDTPWEHEEEQSLAMTVKESKERMSQFVVESPVQLQRSRSDRSLAQGSVSSSSSAFPTSKANYKLHRYIVRESSSLTRFLPFIHFSHKYRLSMLRTHENRVASASYRPMGVRVTAVWSLTERDGEVMVHEELSIRAPKFISWYIFREALHSHIQLMDRLKRLAESEDS